MTNNLALSIFGLPALIACVWLLGNAGCDKIDQMRTNGHDSVPVAQKFVRDRPFDPESYAALGNAWYDQGQYELARENYQKALSLNPRLADVHAELGDNYLMMGRKADARAEWTRALQLDLHVPPTDTVLHARKKLAENP